MTASFAGRTVLVTGAAPRFRPRDRPCLRGRGRRGLRLRRRRRRARRDRADRDRRRCHVRTADVSDRAAVEARGRAKPAAVDILVNNAGGVRGQVGRPLEEVSEADWQAILDVNLTGAFFCAQAVAPGMKRQRCGRIVNISSGAGLGVSLTGIQAYASAKAGQIGLTRQLAHELGPFGITVNNVAPGLRPLEPDHRAPVGGDGRGGPDRAGREHRHAPARQSRGHRPRGPVLRRGGLGLDHRPDLERRRRQDLSMTEAVEALLTAELRRLRRRAEGILPHPSGQHRSGLRRRHAPRRRMGRATGCRPPACSNVEIAQTGGHPAVLGRMAGRSGRARRRSWSTATTTCSRPTRWRCGPPRRSSPRSATAGSMRAVPPTTRDRCWCPILVAEAFLRARAGCRSI